MFKRVTFSTPALVNLERLNEWATLLQKYKVDLLISHRYDNFPAIFPFLFFRLSGVKIIRQLHCSIKHSAFRFPFAPSYSLSDSMVVLSNTRQKFLENLGARSYYVPNPMVINDKEFRGRNHRKISNTVLWVGRIDVEKNPFAVVPIIKEVKMQIPDVKLKILGAADNPNTLETFKQFIATNGLERNIELCGFHTNVSSFYKSADVFLNTSPMEGWSFVIAESKFYELPMVLYELPDVELTRDGKGYISVPQGDSHGAAQAIIKILTDEELRCRLSAQARESLQPFIDYDIAGAWQKIFDDLENDSQIPAHSLESEQIQSMLLEEIFVLTHQVNNLNSIISNLNKH